MDKIRYVNHLGQEINLWGADENRNVIVGSYRSARGYLYSHENGSLYIEPKEWEALIVCSPREKANELIDLLEADSSVDESGKFYFNDWYIRCKYLGISEIVYENEKFIKLSLSFLSFKNEWSREEEIKFIPETAEVSEGLDFPFDFEFDFSSTVSASQTINNTALIPADFRMRFDGIGSATSVSIDGHSYSVNNIVKNGESFFLDTEKETVYKSTPLGNVDLFSASSDTDYIFQKLKPGVSKVVWNIKAPLFITLIEHRRMPPWI
jgi:hypothetical protein